MYPTDADSAVLCATTGDHHVGYTSTSETGNSALADIWHGDDPDNFFAFYQFVPEEYADDISIVLVFVPDIDIVGGVISIAVWHVSNELRVPSSMRLLFLPAYSQELAQMARVWAWRRQHDPSNRVSEDAMAMDVSWNAQIPSRLANTAATSWLLHEASTGGVFLSSNADTEALRSVGLQGACEKTNPTLRGLSIGVQNGTL